MFYKCPCVSCLFDIDRMRPNRYSSFTTNIYKLDGYAGARGFDPELRKYASMVPSPCGLTVVYKMSPPLNLTSRYRLYWVESTINQQLKKKVGFACLTYFKTSYFLFPICLRPWMKLHDLHVFLSQINIYLK